MKRKFEEVKEDKHWTQNKKGKPTLWGVDVKGDYSAAPFDPDLAYLWVHWCKYYNFDDQGEFGEEGKHPYPFALSLTGPRIANQDTEKTKTHHHTCDCVGTCGGTAKAFFQGDRSIVMPKRDMEGEWEDDVRTYKINLGWTNWKVMIIPRWQITWMNVKPEQIAKALQFPVLLPPGIHKIVVEYAEMPKEPFILGRIESNYDTMEEPETELLEYRGPQDDDSAVRLLANAFIDIEHNFPQR